MKLTPDKDKARKMAERLMPHVNSLLLAMAHSQLMRERMNQLDIEMLDHLDVRDKNGERITNPQLLYRMAEKYNAEYFRLRDEWVRQGGLKVKKPGNCPALEAESLVRLAEQAVVMMASEFLPGLTYDSLRAAGGELYDKFIDLTIRLVVNAPGYKAPAIPVPGGA